MNKVLIHGHVGQDPELKETEGKVTVCTFNVATNERIRTGEGETKEITEWHKIVTFGKTADSCGKYLKKGDAVFLEGKIKSSRFKDKTGKDVTVFQISAEDVRFLSKKPAATGGAESEADTALEQAGL